MDATTKANLTEIFGSCTVGRKRVECAISGRTKKVIRGMLEVYPGNMTDLWVCTDQPGRVTQDVHARIDLRKTDALERLTACGVKIQATQHA